MNRDDKPNQTWVFDRYVNGVLMAEGVEVTRASSFEKAMATAARLAARGPNGETPVLVSRTAIDVLARLEDAEAAQALVVERAAKHIVSEGERLADGIPNAGPGLEFLRELADEVRALAPASGVAALAALRAERDVLRNEWEKGPDMTEAQAQWLRKLRDEGAQEIGNTNTWWACYRRFWVDCENPDSARYAITTAGLAALAAHEQCKGERRT